MSVRTALLAAATLTAALFAAPPAHADPDICTASCTFHCHEGDLVNILVIGSGLTASGVGTCGGAVVRCGPGSLSPCRDSEPADRDDDQGLCDLSEGVVAVCWTTPVDDQGVVDPVLVLADAVACPALAQLFPPDGDVEIGLVRLHDCPPYGD